MFGALISSLLSSFLFGSRFEWNFLLKADSVNLDITLTRTILFVIWSRKTLTRFQTMLGYKMICTNCPSSNNSNLPFVDWLEYICQNKLWYNKFVHHPLEKILIIAWTMWNQKNKIIFENQSRILLMFWFGRTSLYSYFSI